ARQSGAAGGGRKRNDERLPRLGARSSRFRHRARRLSPPGGTDVMRHHNRADTSVAGQKNPSFLQRGRKTGFCTKKTQNKKNANGLLFLTSQKRLQNKKLKFRIRKHEPLAAPKE